MSIPDQLLDKYREAAREIIENHNMEHPPMLQVFRRDQLLAYGYLDVIDKELWAAAIQQVVSQLDADGYLFVDEAYLATVPVTSEKSIQDIPMQDIPMDDRDEVIILLSVSRDGYILQDTAKIVTIPGGRRVGQWKRISTVSSAIGGKLVVSW